MAKAKRVHDLLKERSQHEMESLTANVIKSGETAIQTVISRSFEGLRLRVHTLPYVEAFIRESLGQSGEPLDLRSYPRFWQTVGRDTKPLLAYPLAPSRSTEGPIMTGAMPYRLDLLGQPLFAPDMQAGGRSVANLSFLRLVGTSELGVEFLIPGVSTGPEVERTAAAIGEAQKRFFIDFLKPIKINIRIMTEDIPTSVPLSQGL